MTANQAAAALSDATSAVTARYGLLARLLAKIMQEHSFEPADELPVDELRREYLRLQLEWPYLTEDARTEAAAKAYQLSDAADEVMARYV